MGRGGGLHPGLQGQVGACGSGRRPSPWSTRAGRGFVGRGGGLHPGLRGQVGALWVGEAAFTLVYEGM